MSTMYAFRATERGIRERSYAVIAEASINRMVARRTAWEEEQAKIEAAQKRRQEAEMRRLEMQAELRQLGVTFHISYHTIEARAIKVFGVTRAEIRSNRRHRDIVIPRQFIAYWAVRLTKLSLPQIGRLMGGRDHTTVLHHKRKYPQRRAEMGRHLRPTR